MIDDIRLAVLRYRLDNGLRLLVAPMSHSRTAAFTLVVGVGSRHDPPNRQGLTHLLEHMLFRGTARFPRPRALNAAIEALGAPMDASVLRDQTLFQMPIFPEALGEALELVREMFREPRFADLDIEREVVLQERLEEVDERGRANDVDNLAMKALFPDDGLGWSILGTRRCIQAVRADDLRAHLDCFYCGRNTVLAVAGPLEPDAVRALAASTLGRLAPGRAAPPAGAVPRADLPAVLVVSDEGSQADFDVTCLSAPAGHEDAEALDLVVRLLDDGAASRVRARLCDDLGLAYEVGVHHESYADVGLLRTTGAVAPDRVPDVVREVAGLLAELREKPIPADELERVRRRLLLDLLVALESPETVSSWLAETELHRPGEDVREAMGRLLALGPRDVQRVASRYLRASRAQLAVVGDVRRVRRRLDAALAELG